MRPLNNSSTTSTDNDEIILIKSSTNSNLTLNCELKTNLNSNDVKITWFYYKFENEKSKRVKLSYLNGLIKLQTNIKTSDGYKVLTSRLTLNDLRSTQFGYYMCSLENYQIKSFLLPSKDKQIDLNLNSTYFLQIQCKCDITQII